MATLLDGIKEYMEELVGEGLLLSVHFAEWFLKSVPSENFSVFLTYNRHRGELCGEVKKKRLSDCLARQAEILSKGISGVTSCPFGVKEYIYPVKAAGRTAAYFAVGLFDGGKTDYRAKIFPLAYMCENLFSQVAISGEDDYYGIIQYLNENHTFVTLDEVCAEFARSRSHISHLFKKRSGVTIKEYANGLKLEDAHKFLSQGSNVTEAALKAGFNDVSYFIRLYKSKYGETPNKAKKRFQNGV